MRRSRERRKNKINNVQYQYITYNYLGFRLSTSIISGISNGSSAREEGGSGLLSSYYIYFIHMHCNNITESKGDRGVQIKLQMYYKNV